MLLYLNKTRITNYMLTNDIFMKNSHILQIKTYEKSYIFTDLFTVQLSRRKGYSHICSCIRPFDRCYFS